MKTTQYIAQIKVATQISPDDFVTETPALSIDDKTTIGEIMNWSRSISKYNTEVKIIQLQENT